MARTRDAKQGARVQALRKAVRGLTQQALAERLGVHVRTVQDWEQGFGVPQSKMPQLARALHATPQQIWGVDAPAALASGEPRAPDSEALEAARDGFAQTARLISELRAEMQARDEAQNDVLRELVLEVRRLQRELAQATADTPGTSQRTPRGAERPPGQASR